jgi:hypothetical protein
MIQAGIERVSLVVRAKVVKTFDKGSGCPACIAAIPIHLVEGGGKKHGCAVGGGDLDSRFQDRVRVGTDGEQGNLGFAAGAQVDERAYKVCQGGRYLFSRICSRSPTCHLVCTFLC